MERLIEFVTNHWDLWLALAVVLFFLVKNLFGDRLGGYTQVAPQQASGLISHEDAVVVDVREDREYREGHILNSIHIPLGALKGRIGELEKYRERPLLIYCRSGHRSSHACSILHKQQFQRLYNLGGGIVAWQNANLPLSRK